MQIKNFVIQLETLTSRRTDEDVDEFYVLGAVRAKDQSGNIVGSCTGNFASTALTSFARNRVPETKQLDPAGEAFHGTLISGDYWTVDVLLILVEQDTATVINNVNRELIAFLHRNQNAAAQLTAAPGFAALGPLAELFLDFVQTISNIFDKDDVFRTYSEQFTVRPTDADKNLLRRENGTHLDALYDPWRFRIKIFTT